MNSLIFLGDVYLPDTYIVKVDFTGKIIFNMEFPITTCANGYCNKINLKSITNNIMTTFRRKPYAVSLANNHIIDYGEQGFIDTVKILDSSEIKYFGAGYLAENCQNPLLVEINEQKLAFLGYVCETAHPVFAKTNRPGVLPIKLEKIGRDITLAKNKGASKIIVSLHWGAEEVYLPKPDDVVNARQIIDSGADMVIGHHSHCIQPFEIYKGKYIFYGLGNCIMPDLNVPAFFSKGNCPGEYYIKKQFYWNKSSLMVCYDIVTGGVKISQLYFDGKTLIQKKGRKNINQYKLKSFRKNIYNSTFKKSFLVGKLRTKLFSFMHNPKLPTFRHLKSIISLLNRKEYS